MTAARAARAPAGRRWLLAAVVAAAAATLVALACARRSPRRRTNPQQSRRRLQVSPPPGAPPALAACCDLLLAPQPPPPTTTAPLPFFQSQQRHLVAEIVAAKKRSLPLLVHGAPGIGKGAACAALVAAQAALRPALYLDLLDFIPLPSDSDGDPSSIAVAWIRALEASLGITRARAVAPDFPIGSPFPILSAALSLIRDASRYGPTLLVIDNLQLLFNDSLPIDSFYADLYPSFQWLLQSQSNAILDLIFCSSSSKSVMLSLKRFHGYDSRLRFKSLESVDDPDVIDYILDQLNPSIPPHRQFSIQTAQLFVHTFDGNLLELERYCASDLTVQEYISQREDAFLEHLQHHIPSRPPKPQSQTNPFDPPTSKENDFRDIILEIIMRNGVLPLSHLDADRLSLVEVLVENNFLRWRDARIRRREQSNPYRRSSSYASTNTSVATFDVDAAAAAAAHTNDSNPSLHHTDQPRADPPLLDSANHIQSQSPHLPSIHLSTESLPNTAVDTAIHDPQSEQDRIILEQCAKDPFIFLRRGDTELVWYNRLVGNVCERWFNQNAW